MASKILVIDDDKDIRDIITFILEEEGYEVIASGDSRILTSVMDFSPYLVLIDNWLTEWKTDATGEQLCRGLKSNKATSHIPVIIMSAVNNVKEIAEAGLADAYLKKPFDMDELLAIVKKIIK
jgi:two-component system phosphate regulon response regulator PhoB